MKRFNLISALFLFLAGNSYAQQSITLSGEQPLWFTSTGTGTYNKTVLYHSSTNGFLLELAKLTDSHNGVPVDFKVETRGATHKFFTIKGSTGNVGIGTGTPSSKLEIKGDLRINDGSSAHKGIIRFGSSDVVFENSPSGSNYGDLQIKNWNGAAHVNTLRINANGNIGIGTTTPDSKLTVAGNIHAREVKVTVTAGADFVFADDYALPDLKSVEAYVKENKHLPEIASAAEMEANGLLLAEMNIKLLKKVEELTLYTIQQEKQLEEQRKAEEEQQALIQQLISRMELLEQK